MENPTQDLVPIEAGHWNYLSDKFNNVNSYPDCIIQVCEEGGSVRHTIHAHKVLLCRVDMFEVMFRFPVQWKREKFKMLCTDVDTGLALLKWCYDIPFTLTEDNIVFFLRESMLFQIKPVILFCWRFFFGHLEDKPTLCFDVVHMLKAFEPRKTLPMILIVLGYMCANVGTLHLDSRFGEMDASLLIVILSSSHLNVHSEEEVMQCVLSYLGSAETVELEDLDSLLDCVRYVNTTRSSIQSILSAHAIVSDELRSRIVHKFFTSEGNQVYWASNVACRQFITNKKVALIPHVACQGGKTPFHRALDTYMKKTFSVNGHQYKSGDVLLGDESFFTSALEVVRSDIARLLRLYCVHKGKRSSGRSSGSMASRKDDNFGAVMLDSNTITEIGTRYQDVAAARITNPPLRSCNGCEGMMRRMGMHICKKCCTSFTIYPLPSSNTDANAKRKRKEETSQAKKRPSKRRKKSHQARLTTSSGVLRVVDSIAMDFHNTQ